VNIHLLVDVKKNLTIVPGPAIQRGPQGTYVYAVGEGNTVKIQPVVVAQITGNSAGVSSGINPGDVVVIDGQDKLQDGSKIVPNTSSGGSSQGGNGKSGASTQSPSAAKPVAPQGSKAR